VKRLRRAYRTRLGWVPRSVRRVIIGVIGGTVLLIGLVMVVAPGPAFLVLPLGLAILALEFLWARLWLRKIKRTAGRLMKRGGKADASAAEAESETPQGATAASDMKA
jgi:uncharacterized protein (TIGR02611 family)